MNAIKVEKIVVNIGGKDLELTLEQARELRDVLNNTLPEKQHNVTVIRENHWGSYPSLGQPVWVAPTYQPISAPWPDTSRVTCGLQGMQSTLTS